MICDVDMLMDRSTYFNIRAGCKIKIGIYVVFIFPNTAAIIQQHFYLVGTKLGNGFMNRLSDIINIVWSETAHANAAILQ